MKPPITLDDYAQAADAFVESLAPIKKEIKALYLFGSFARGEAVAGYSDLDFWLFFNPDLFQNDQRFTAAIRCLVSAMHQIHQSGIPVHNVCCYASAALIHQMPAMLVSNLKPERGCRLLMGEDIRPQMEADPASQKAHRAASFFEMRRQLYLPLSMFLQRDSISEKEQFIIFQSLQYVKYLPEAACAALNQWPGEVAARQTLQTLLPQIELSPIDEIRQYCIEQGPLAAWGTMKPKLHLALDFVEALNHLLIQRQTRKKA